MIFGMAEPFQQAMVKLGRRVRLYSPVGRLLPGMAYLVRRLLENTSNESFLQKEYVESQPLHPAPRSADSAAPAPTHNHERQEGVSTTNRTATFHRQRFEKPCGEYRIGSISAGPTMARWNIRYEADRPMVGIP